jgi:hypothetical protein
MNHPVYTNGITTMNGQVSERSPVQAFRSSFLEQDATARPPGLGLVPAFILSQGAPNPSLCRSESR